MQVMVMVSCSFSNSPPRYVLFTLLYELHVHTQIDPVLCEQPCEWFREVYFNPIISTIILLLISDKSTLILCYHILMKCHKGVCMTYGDMIKELLGVGR